MENNKVFTLADEAGDARVEAYEVFPGVQVAYYSVHMEQMNLECAMEGRLIEIHHCREGRIEQQFDDRFFYLMPGDLSIAVRDKVANEYHFPLKHYHGITIGITMDVVPEAFRDMLREIGVDPMQVARKLCEDDVCCIFRAVKQIGHVFSELYSVPEEIRLGYLKLKIMELFLVLGSIHECKNQLPACVLPRAHVRLANQAADYLSERMDQHITIQELSQTFGVSDTHMKSVFKGVYGVPVFSYMRIRKMQAAGQMLIHGDKSIAEISEEFGYLNTGKFSAAFQSVMGETPSEYRRAHGRANVKVNSLVASHLEHEFVRSVVAKTETV